jgi:hypothetical protein
VSGYHLTVWTGTEFLLRIMVGAVALLELSVLWIGARCTAPDTQRPTSNVRSRSPAESATPGSNINGDPIAPRSHRHRSRGQ